MSSPGPDRSVRIGWADDAAAMARIQIRAWRAEYGEVLGAEVLDSLDENDLTQAWRQALVRPADARQRVLVALDRVEVCGFVLTAPSPDPDADPLADGEMSELTVDPDRRGHGHGSRLMQAAVDTLRTDRFVRATTWLGSDQDRLREFLGAAGWSADGAHRTLDLSGDGRTQVRQVRLHTRIAG